MFTEQFLTEMEQAFEKQMERLGDRKQAVLLALGQCSKDEAEALKCLYASMPISDAADYTPELFYSYAKHGAKLWQEGPFAGKVPQELFAGYVLHHRVNNEDLTDSRTFFYEQLKEEIKGMSMEEAVLAINYWCASQATYRTTDGRTLSAASVYRSAYGRCGEESTFGVSVLRSMGIPARQVYVPLWSHCDDNHAWVEVWCDGTWKFLGACEPEEILNKGWFTSASSRAMMVHSRFMLPSKPKEDIVGKKGISFVLNQLKRYANTIDLSVRVVTEDGSPAVGAEISFEVLNYACFGEIATVYADADGACMLQTGIGTLHITALLDGNYGSLLVNTGEQQACTVVLGETGEKKEVWENLVVQAPKDAPINRRIQTEEEIKQGREKQKVATELRLEKEEQFCKETEDSILKKAKGNYSEIEKFLTMSTNDNWPEEFRLAILNSLREKDYIDITADILAENCRECAQFVGNYKEEILQAYVLCPRVDNEMIRPFRSFINGWLTKTEKENILESPSAAFALVNARVTSKPELEYGNLITSAKGALTSGWGSELTKKVVTVQILRTLGIASRLNPADGILEVYKDGEFIPIEAQENEEQARTCSIFIPDMGDTRWVYFQNWTIARFENGRYKTLRLCGENGEEVTGEIPLFAGTYRIVTANRLPNGTIFASRLVFELKEGEKREIVLQQMEAQVSDMLTAHDIAEFKLKTEEQKECLASQLVKDRQGLFIWLEESMEPTEHILNEIYERRAAYENLPANLYFIIRDTQAKEDKTFAKVLENVPHAKVLLDDFGPDLEVLARRMYLEPDKLPLIVIIDEDMNGVYGSAGYNVGTADMVLKILNMQKDAATGGLGHE